MEEYFDNNSKDDDGSETFTLNDDDSPLLINDKIESGTFEQPCLFGQRGFRRVSVDVQGLKAKKQLIAATSLCFVFMIAELIGGYLSGSLAIITDAAHLLSDCISFIVALIAIWLSKKPADQRMSFGYKRAEVIGAILSVIGIWILTAILVYLAMVRLINGNFDINADTMIIVSSIGVIINIVMGIVLHGSCILLPHGHSHGGKLSHSHSHSHNLLNNNNHHHQHQHNNNSTTIFVGGHNNHSHSHLLSSASDTMTMANGCVVSGGGGGVGGNNVGLVGVLANGGIGGGGGGGYNLIRNNSFNSLNNSNNNSRHNSFSKLLNNKTKDEHHLHRGSIDLLRAPHIVDEPPLIHRMSIDGGLQRISVDNNRTYSHSRLCQDDLLIYPNVIVHRNNSVDSSNSSGDSSPSDIPKQNINIRAAVIHVIGDFIQSIGVLIAAVVIKLHPNAKIADPICTFFFSIIVIFTTIRIMRDSVMVLLDAVPITVSLSKLSTELNCIQGVRSVHHLNVWSLTVDWNIMSVHLIVEPIADTEEILQAATTIARKGFDIKHSTIQIEKLNSILLNQDITTELLSNNLVGLGPTNGSIL